MKIYTVFERDGNDEPIYERFFTSKEARQEFINWLVKIGVPKNKIYKSNLYTDTAKSKKYCLFSATKNRNNTNKIKVAPYPYSGCRSKYWRDRLNKVEITNVEPFTAVKEPSQKYRYKRTIILATSLQKAKEKAEILFA